MVSKVFAWKTHDRIPKKSGTEAEIFSSAEAPGPLVIRRGRQRAAQTIDVDKAQIE
jgi:hypothetical protein